LASSRLTPPSDLSFQPTGRSRAAELETTERRASTWDYASRLRARRRQFRPREIAMRLEKLAVLPFLLMLNSALLAGEPATAESPDLKTGLVLLYAPSIGGADASTPDWSARLLAADDSTAKCGATCQEKRDACYAQCKTSDNPKIRQSGCLDTYKTCRGTCGK